MNYPNVNDTVKVTITEVNELGLLVNILPYSECEGFILLAEKTRQSKKTKPKYQIGTQHDAIVLRVDSVNGYVDLKLIGTV